MKDSIENRITKLEVLLDRISTNELPHLQKTSDKILWWIIGGFTTIIVAIIIHGVLTYFQIK